MVLSITIFDPKYIDLVDYALEHDQLISIASPMPSSVGTSDGDKEPPFRPILGAGEIITKKEVAPKRYVIFVHGVTRILLREELEKTHAFRQVEAEILRDEAVDQSSLQTKENELRNLMQVYAAAHTKSAEDIYTILKKSPNAEVLSHLLGARIPCSPKDKRKIFEELNPLQRLELIKRHLSGLLLKVTRQKKHLCIH
jgi:Lon protease-like protein